MHPSCTLGGCRDPCAHPSQHERRSLGLGLMAVLDFPEAMVGWKDHQEEVGPFLRWTGALSPGPPIPGSGLGLPQGHLGGKGAVIKGPGDVLRVAENQGRLPGGGNE